MGKFSLGAVKATENKEKSLKDKASLLENKKSFDFRQIQFEEIKANDKNFYSIENIEDLANSIKEFGLMHNITVLETQEGEKRFRIISGERRYRAIELIRNQGIQGWEVIPCKVVKNLSDIDEELMLLKGNSDTRELTQEEKRKQIEKLTTLYEQKSSLTGEKISKTEIKETVASDVGMSSKQVERYSTINENLLPQLKDYFDNKKISFSEAVKFARLDEQMQLAILDLLQQKDKISNEEIEVIKLENKKLIEENKQTKIKLDDRERQLQRKEEFISQLNVEKSKLESEVEKNKIELETAEEEKSELENKIREEIATLTEEEVTKLKDQLDKANAKAKELEKREGQLNKDLINKKEELDKTLLELEEHKKSDNNKEVDKEQLIKAIELDKFKQLKATVIESVIKLGDLAKKCNDLELAQSSVEEIEKAITVYKNKMNKIK